MCQSITEKKFLVVLLLFKSPHSTLNIGSSICWTWTNYLDLVNTAIHPCESNPLPGLSATLMCSEPCPGFMTHFTLHHHVEAHWSGPNTGALIGQPLPICKTNKCSFNGDTVGNVPNTQTFALTEMTWRCWYYDTYRYEIRREEFQVLAQAHSNWDWHNSLKDAVHEHFTGTVIYSTDLIHFGVSVINSSLFHEHQKKREKYQEVWPYLLKW